MSNKWKKSASGSSLVDKFPGQWMGLLCSKFFHSLAVTAERSLSLSGQLRDVQNPQERSTSGNTAKKSILATIHSAQKTGGQSLMHSGGYICCSQYRQE